MRSIAMIAGGLGLLAVSLAGCADNGWQDGDGYEERQAGYNYYPPEQDHYYAPGPSYTPQPYYYWPSAPSYAHPPSWGHRHVEVGE